MPRPLSELSAAAGDREADLLIQCGDLVRQTASCVLAYANRVRSDEARAELMKAHGLIKEVWEATGGSALLAAAVDRACRDATARAQARGEEAA